MKCLSWPAVVGRIPQLADARLERSSAALPPEKDATPDERVGRHGAALIELPDSIGARMRTIARKSYPNETGGILIGCYDERHCTALVRCVTGPPRDSVCGPFTFRRGIRGLDTLLARAWRRGLYYLGEWHFHSEVLPPSELDRRATDGRVCANCTDALPRASIAHRGASRCRRAHCGLRIPSRARSLAPRPTEHRLRTGSE